MFRNKKVAAIIAEYNPFHNGHEYHIQKTREMTEVDYVIILMSTNYVQRGEPAILDRYERAEAALKHGADAVFELPLTVSLGSADLFSRGAVALAEELGMIDYLSFGAETPEETSLLQAANILIQNKELEETVKKYMAEGFTFPESRERYLIEKGYQKEAKLLSSPNNILGISYLTSLLELNSKIKPLAIGRKASLHHSKQLEYGTFSSAMAIRESLRRQEAVKTLPYLPKASSKQVLERSFLHHEDYSDLLFYKLNSIIHGYSKKTAIELLSSYQNIGKDLAGRIYNQFKGPLQFTDFSLQLWGKNYTLARIQRALYHLILGITKDLIAKNRESNFCPYIRPLAIKKDALGILGQIKRNTEKKQKPLLTRIGDIKKTPNEISKETFELHRASLTLYQQLLQNHHGIRIHDEIKNGFMKIY